MKTPYGLIDGVVVDTEDPQQMGRVKIWCPSIDGDLSTVKYENLPWATYSSPFAGQTRNYPAGGSGTKTNGLVSYGFWGVPKVGAQVIVGLLYGDSSRRIYISSFFSDHGNRSLPTGRNRPDIGPDLMSDTLDPMEPASTNLKAQFKGNLQAPQAKTRGAYERQAGQDKDIRDGSEGYQKGVVDSKLDPQTYCLTTPGRHTLIFQDHPTNARIRMRTAEGHQIIMDDANERIYVSVAGGNAFFEMDKDGHVHFYSGASFSISAADKLNLSAGGDVMVAAGGNLHMSAGGSARLTGCDDVSISGATVNIESSGSMNILAAGQILQTGSQIHLNGPGAGSAKCADGPSIVPNHEPWTRPSGKTKRGPNWKA